MQNETYDSARDTRDHIKRVIELMGCHIFALQRRSWAHDKSKLSNAEKPLFDIATPKLRALTYGTPEYQTSLDELKPALDHHYASNSHHPEHHSEGVAGMSIFDLLEMLADWKAAGERHAKGSVARSMEINRERYRIAPALFLTLVKTVRELDWINDAETAHLRTLANKRIKVASKAKEPVKPLTETYQPVGNGTTPTVIPRLESGVAAAS